jgi:hypothetical protein
VNRKDRVRTPVDSFVLAKLEAKGLSFSADAPRLALMRRAYFDLTGLPPTPEQINQYTADTKPGAYERLIDTLLESPQYGERWGRHWLDTAGYSDAAGFDNCFPVVELYEGMWRYRDYVVDAFNKDKPYDRFVIEQLAGDEIVDWRGAAKYTPEIVEALTATGYLRSVYDRTDADIVNLIVERWDVMVHLIEKISTNLMGLTVGCARCHTHKYDPIPQRDYYRMAAIFTPAYNPMNWTQPKNRFLADVSKGDQKAVEEHNKEIDEQVKRLEREQSKLRKPYQDKLSESKLAGLPEALRTDARAAMETAAERRDEVQKYLAGKFGRMLAVTSEEVLKALSKDDLAADAKVAAQIKTLNGYRRSFNRIQALWDVGPPPKTRLLQRGAVESPGPRVKAGVPEALTVGVTDLDKPAGTKGETSGFRLAFAQWLTSPKHPLTARVMVNRVWQHHFGVGIVETPENFGKMGAAPTHPELLDWMSVHFVENGWSIKKLHRLIMTSTAYRQSSRQPSGTPPQADPENKLLWRMNLRRLEAEAVRDGVLAASGKLDAMLKARPDGSQELQEGRNRRSLYILSRRNHPYQLLQVFDFPTIQVNCNRRARSATPLQALSMLNDDVLVEAAANMASRILSQPKPVEAAYMIALSRPPSAEETATAEAFLAEQRDIHRVANLSVKQATERAAANLCQILLASNEFLYVE